MNEQPLDEAGRLALIDRICTLVRAETDSLFGQISVHAFLLVWAIADPEGGWVTIDHEWQPLMHILKKDEQLLLELATRRYIRHADTGAK